MNWWLALLSAMAIQLAFVVGSIALNWLTGDHLTDYVYERSVGSVAVLALALCLRNKRTQGVTDERE